MSLLCAEKLRSVRWRISLHIFDVNDTPEEAHSKLEVCRAVYRHLRHQHVETPANLNTITEDDNNADEEEEEEEVKTRNPWFADALSESIHVDVVRTFSGDEYFQRDSTREMLGRILLVWSRHNSDMGYRQGMNELLALVLIALRQDYQHITQSIPRTVRDLVDEHYMEEDAFVIFDALMRLTKPWYTPGSVAPSPANAADQVRARASSAASPLYMKFNRIHNVLLKRCDPELYEFLAMADILPQLYLLRWIRVLFSREFTLEQSLLIWDEILARSPRPPAHHVLRGDEDDFVNFFCVAMLVYIREQLLSTGDVNSSIMMLMKYPPTSNVVPLLQLCVEIQTTGQEAVLKFIEQRTAAMVAAAEAADDNNNNTSSGAGGGGGGGGGGGEKKKKKRMSKLFSLGRGRRRKDKPKAHSLVESNSEQSFRFSLLGTSTSPSTLSRVEASLLTLESAAATSSLSTTTGGGGGGHRRSVDEWDAYQMKAKMRSEGWLVKRGGGTRLLGRHSLKKRWFVLHHATDDDEAYLAYYKDAESTHKPLKERIILHGRAIKILDRGKFFFAIMNGPTKQQKRTYHLYAPSYRDMIEWVSALQSAAATTITSTAL